MAIRLVRFLVDDVAQIIEATRVGRTPRGQPVLAEAVGALLEAQRCDVPDPELAEQRLVTVRRLLEPRRGRDDDDAPLLAAADVDEAAEDGRSCLLA